MIFTQNSPVNAPLCPCCVLIAAGLSSRMGTFKPLLPIGGTPAIRFLIRNMRTAGIKNFVIVTGHNGSQIRSACQDLSSVIWVRNPHYASTGMFESAKLGFEHLPSGCDRILFTPADIPLVSPATIHQILIHPGQLVFPSWQYRKGHPISIHANLLPDILHYHGSDGLRGALRALHTVPEYVTVNDPAILMDMDTPEDYRKILQQYEKSRALFQSDAYGQSALFSK